MIKKYQRKNQEIPELKEYNDNLGDNYWAKWPSNKPTGEKLVSWIDHVKLRNRAEKAGYSDKVMLNYVCSSLRDGATLGTRGSARLPSEPRNKGKLSNYDSA